MFLLPTQERNLLKAFLYFCITMLSRMNHLVRIILLLPFFFSFQAFSQKDTLTKKISTTYFYNESQFETDSTCQVDNTLHNFQNYIPKAHLGNSGLAFNDPAFSPLQFEPGSYYRKNNYQPYFFSPHTIKFFNTRTPFSDLFYLTGSKREQVFNMTFSYNLRKNWNISVDFFRIRSEGFYRRQNTNNNCIAISSNYRSLNDRYRLLTALIYNSAESAENGGVSDDSVFESGSNASQNLFDISLETASNSTKNRIAFLKQYFNLGKPSADTSKKHIIPASRFVLTSSYEDNLMTYEDQDPLSGFYSNIYYDSTKTYDSTFYRKISNELAWQRLDNKKHRGIIDMIGIGLSAKHQYVELLQREVDTAFNNVHAGAQFYNTYSNNKLWWKISAEYILSGYNQNDYYASAIVKKNIIDSLNVITLRGSIRQQRPDLIYDRYSSNHFKWDNEMLASQQMHADLSFAMLKYDMELNAGITNYTNIPYFDNYAIARQYKGSVAVITARLRKDISLFNWHLNNTVVYQNVPDSTVIRLPELILNHSLYYEKDVFKKAMRLQVGASLYFTSAGYTNAYMPATTQFYLQNEKKYGNYPFIDFFINVRVKAVRVMIKIDHLNAGWSGSGYMQTPHYPMSGRTFKFGLSWRFYD